MGSDHPFQIDLDGAAGAIRRVEAEGATDTLSQASVDPDTPEAPASTSGSAPPPPLSLAIETLEKFAREFPLVGWPYGSAREVESALAVVLAAARRAERLETWMRSNYPVASAPEPAPPQQEER